MQKIPISNPVDFLIPDINGVMRGKWGAHRGARQGRLSRQSTCRCRSSASTSGAGKSNRPAFTSRLATSTATAGQFPGEIKPRALGAASLRPGADVDVHRDRRALASTIRANVLQAIVDRYTALGLRPGDRIRAGNSYLVDPAVFQPLGPDGQGPGTGTGPAADVLAVRTARPERPVRRDPRGRRRPGPAIDTIIKEAAPGQFEVNLKHRDDAMAAATTPCCCAA